MGSPRDVRSILEILNSDLKYCILGILFLKTDVTMSGSCDMTCIKKLDFCCGGAKNSMLLCTALRGLHEFSVILYTGN